jgi:hypothetical protein
MTEGAITQILTSPSSIDYLVEPPLPVLLNTWKHHAGALRQRIAQTAAVGILALEALPEQMQVLGTELMDLYTGDLAPVAIAVRVLEQLQVDGVLPLSAFRAWVESNGGYQVLTFPDQSRWVLRLGEEDGRYVHVHPARWAPATLRVRANVLKTAVMVLAYASVQHGNPLDVKLINRVRTQYLGFSPIRALTGDVGLRGVIEMLRDP